MTRPSSGLLMLPLPDGGEVDPVTFVHVIEAVAHDGSTAWCLCQAAGCLAGGAYLTSRSRENLGLRDAVLAAWGPGPTRAVAVDGGYRVTGTWSSAKAGAVMRPGSAGTRTHLQETDGSPRRRAPTAATIAAIHAGNSRPGARRSVDVACEPGCQGNGRLTLPPSRTSSCRTRTRCRARRSRGAPASRRALYCFPSGEPLRLRVRRGGDRLSRAPCWTLCQLRGAGAGTDDREAGAARCATITWCSRRSAQAGGAASAPRGCSWRALLDEIWRDVGSLEARSRSTSG